MLQWPIPNYVKALRGFLGLVGYYRKLIKGFGVIVAPLNALLRKEAFQWSSPVEVAFHALKLSISNSLVLALLDVEVQIFLYMPHTPILFNHIYSLTKKIQISPINHFGPP